MDPLLEIIWKRLLVISESALLSYVMVCIVTIP